MKQNKREILAQLYLDQTVGKECWGYQNYQNVMEAFEKTTDGDIRNMLEYLHTHKLPLDTSLRELYHKASSWRAFDYYKGMTRPKIKKDEPYSVSMLLKLKE